MAMGPHCIRTTDAGRKWAEVAPIVKGCGNVGILQSAPANAVRVFRWVFAQQNLDDPVGTSRIIIDMLAGYNHPQLFVEVWNEAHPTLAQLKAVTDLLHAAGYRVAGGSWGTGDFTALDWEIAVQAGCDAISCHAYWDPGVMDIWEAFRYRQFWAKGDPPVIVTECGRRHGQNTVTELVAYANQITNDSAFVLGATPFTCGATQDWIDQGFDLDPMTPDLIAALGGQPVPTPAPTPTSIAPIYGIDLSNNNGAIIPWSVIARTFDFVAMKASEGLHFVDPDFADNWAAAGDLGLPRIAYHFGRPSQGSGHDEAEFFLETASKDVRSGDIFALDSEDTNVAPDADLAAHDLDFFHTADPSWGAPGLFYSGRWYTVPHKLEGNAELATHGLWLAQYGTSKTVDLPVGWPFWAIHQYGQGPMPGLTNIVDLNRFNGTVAQLRKYGKP